MELVDDHPTGLLEMTNAEYHGAPGISKSKLDAVAVSELNYWDQYVNPNRESEDEKHCFIVGDGTHKLVLEPGTFEQTYAVGFDKTEHAGALDTVADLKKALGDLGEMVSGSKPELIERLRVANPKARIMAVLEAEHNRRIAGRTPIPARDYKNMLSMLAAVENDPVAGPLLKGARTEQSFFVYEDIEVIDPETGEVIPVQVLKKCRTDAITANGLLVADLKTTDDVSEEGFGATIARRRYHVQAAWYLDILRKLYGRDAPQYWAIVAAQKTRPFDVAVHYLTDDEIEAGRRIYQQDLARLILAEQRDYWPGVARGKPIKASLPRWETRRFPDLFGL
ncbi:exonuclease VIII [Bordetella phage vB_BbrM_PHB04]|uniref:Exonuclease VIII n=1 Tax=Bordetella phage vB_BbrM_PHB04 TaxID=2029657 RepID=A0A291LA82_9CAUD|nr:exonuclease VIII [Bordetella phage vB_BbrM_PHB04]ATI15723.1 exonuclease VIII [Bordetella phage vB_BbrM_PHB04]